MIAVVTLKNTPLIDVIGSMLDGRKTVNIQVKTKQNLQGWKLTDKMEEQVEADNFFVVFVDLATKDKIDYYIIPRNELAQAIRAEHRRWLAEPGRGGHVRVDNPIRAFDPDSRGFRHPQLLKYKNNWETLELF